MSLQRGLVVLRSQTHTIEPIIEKKDGGKSQIGVKGGVMEIHWEHRYFVAFLAGLVLVVTLCHWWHRLWWKRVNGEIIGHDGEDDDGGRLGVATYTVDGHAYQTTDMVGCSPRIGDVVEIRYPAGYPADGYIDHPVVFAVFRIVGLGICIVTLLVVFG